MASRRDFVKRAAGAGMGAAALGAFPFHALESGPAIRRQAVRPVSIASANGLRAVDEAMSVMSAGGSTLEGVVRGVEIVELDPEVMSVGYGGLPNENGVVQLDASVMHGPTRGAGAVGALEGVKTPARVAVTIMRYTDHVFLVSDHARTFARQMGFDADEELLTEAARQRWLAWRTGSIANWLGPDDSGEPIDGFTIQAAADHSDPELAALDSYDGVRPTGTINCNAIDRNGNLSGTTTTSGFAWKIPGRVGDSPIIGAGLYLDNDVGACGSTGRGEAVIKTVGSHAVVDAMRRGASPTDACLEVLRRIVDWTVEPRLQRPDGRPDFNVNFYALNKDGDFGAAAIWSGGSYAVNVDGNGEIRDSAYLFER